MPTIKHRINISPDKDMEKTLRYVAKRDGVPTATKVVELLRSALDLEEDLAWTTLAETRLSQKNIKFVSHKDAWKRFTSK